MHFAGKFLTTVQRIMLAINLKMVLRVQRKFESPAPPKPYDTSSTPSAEAQRSGEQEHLQGGWSTFS
eukprot:bmy_21093T0